LSHLTRRWREAFSLWAKFWQVWSRNFIFLVFS